MIASLQKEWVQNAQCYKTPNVIKRPKPVYIQHSERQQLGLERRFFKYSEIQGERETLARGVYGGYTLLHTNGKEKTELQETLKAY